MLLYLLFAAGGRGGGGRSLEAYSRRGVADWLCMLYILAWENAATMGRAF